MKRLITAGSTILGLSLIGFGVVQLVTQNFLTSLLPFTTLPAKLLWVNVTAIMFLLCGVFLMLRKSAARAATVTALLFTLFFLYPHLPRLLSNIYDPRVWTVAFETLAIASGAWIISAAAISDAEKTKKWMAPAQVAGKLSRFVFAICLLVFGIQHFMYTKFIVSLMPAWLPAKIVWAYLVEFGFILAALSLFLNKLVNQSMFLLGSMFLSWVILLHGPRALSKPTDANEWTSLCLALAISGIAFYISAVAVRRPNKVFSIKNSELETDYVITT
jgi:uncharacterized membrane protein